VEVIFNQGVYLPELDLWLDSRRRKDLGLISHAHADHTARHYHPILTVNTKLLLSEYLKKSSPTALDYREPLETPKYTLTLYPAGHCLGSAQALVESKVTGERLLYTGDFKSRPSPINEPLQPVPCDILVIEATYGRSEYVFPCEKQVLTTAFNTLRHWLSKGEKPVVQGWRLGKSQEVLHYLLAEGFDVAVEESAYKVAEVYEQAGVKFPGRFGLFNRHWPEGQVIICPPGRRSAALLRNFRGKRFMGLTGWSVNGGNGWGWGRRGDASLPYSDHADFNELVDYVRQVQPSQVYTVNGFPDLAAHLRKLGYPAVHLDGNGAPHCDGFQLRLL
jgi:Cft2 family RNA processing exonuclease